MLRAKPLRLLASPLSLSLLTASLVACGGETTAPVDQHDLVVRDVMLIDGTGAAARPASIAVKDGRISAITEGSEAPPSAARTLDGAGRHLLPGFVDLLTHVSARSSVPSDPSQFVDPVAQLAETMREVVDEPDPDARVAAYEEVLRASLRGGVTTFVDSITAEADVLRLAAVIDDRAYPNFRSLGPILAPPGAHPPALDGTAWKRELPISADFATWKAELAADLDRYLADPTFAGVKVAVDSTEKSAGGEQVPKEVIQTICDAAHAHGKACFFLAYTAQGMKDAAAAGGDVKLQAPLVIGPLGISPPPDDVWQALAAGQVTILSLVSTFANLPRYVGDPSLLDGDPHSRYPEMSAAARAGYDALLAAFGPIASAPPDWTNPLSAYYHGTGMFAEAARDVLAAAHHEHGLTVVPTTSAGSPFVFHGTFALELRYLHEQQEIQGKKGFLGTDAVIRAATLDAARAVHLDAEVGSIEIGKKADMVLLDGDPYADPANLTRVGTVIKSGTVHEG